MLLILTFLGIAHDCKVVSAAETKENETVVVVYPKNDVSDRDNENPAGQEIHIINSVTRGNTRPGKLWNLEQADYLYEIQNMRDHVYTDRYFEPDDNGCISISTDGLHSGGKSIKIIFVSRLMKRTV